jgi:Ca-activated chloride channel family protein
MKKLAKRGDGNFAYIDRLDEARKALVEELGATLVTVAKDVKLQVEFNPAVVRGYRLLGYEGRLLRDEDFTDDAKDAGDVGAGHTVTALYEVVPVGAASPVTLRGSEPLRYAGGDAQAARRAPGDELLHVALRYKRPGETTSRLLTAVVPARAPRTAGSDDLRFAASVAAFGMLLRESPFKGETDVQQVLTLARAALGTDPGGYRAEFVRLVERWREIEPVVAGR